MAIERKRNQNFYINEGNNIGSQEAQAFGVTQKQFTASVALFKGEPLMITDNWKVGPATAGAQVVGLAFQDYAADEEVVFITEGWVKMFAAAAIAAGDKVTPAGDGHIKTCPAGAISIADAGGVYNVTGGTVEIVTPEHVDLVVADAKVTVPADTVTGNLVGATLTVPATPDTASVTQDVPFGIALTAATEAEQFVYVKLAL